MRGTPTNQGLSKHTKSAPPISLTLLIYDLYWVFSDENTPNSITAASKELNSTKSPWSPDVHPGLSSSTKNTAQGDAVSEIRMWQNKANKPPSLMRNHFETISASENRRYN